MQRATRRRWIVAIFAGSVSTWCQINPAHAAAVISTDNGTSIGSMTTPKYYGPGYSAFWQVGAPDYALLTNTGDTWVNAPSVTGSIHFRTGNGAPNGKLDIMTIEGSGEVDINSAGSYAINASVSGDGGIGIQAQGNLNGIRGFASQSDGSGVEGIAVLPAKIGVTGNGQSGGYGVWGSADGGWPTVGVLGNNGASGGTAIAGIASNTSSSFGVFGQGATMGVQGYATATSGMGVSGVASGASGHAIDAICNGSCMTGNGLAGNFAGSVTITTSQNGSGGNLTVTTGTASKPGGGAWTATSDVRTKKDVSSFGQGLAELAAIRPVSFKYNGLGGTVEDGKEYIGVIAQELEESLPAMVSSRRAKLHPSDKADVDIKQVDSTAFTFMLINAVNEQQRTIERQETRIAALERVRGPFSSSAVGGWALAAALGLVPLSLVLFPRRRGQQG